MGNESEAAILLLDIDQTLAGGIVGAHLNKYNQDLQLGMSSEDIALSDQIYNSTFGVPDIAFYRVRGEQEFQRSRKEVRTSHKVHIDLKELPGSVEGVNALVQEAGFVFGKYYTVRPDEVEAATKEWLTAKDFREPEKVVICKDPKDKLQKILNDWVIGTEQEVVLIDDGLQKLVEAAVSLSEESEEYRDALKRLILVGFAIPQGTRMKIHADIYPSLGLRVMNLNSWSREDLQDLVAQFL